ncbi:MAG TPA: hypothetical protein V6C97_05470 [Oculatellaceae cyanobacterium]
MNNLLAITAEGHGGVHTPSSVSSETPKPFINPSHQCQPSTINNQPSAAITAFSSSALPVAQNLRVGVANVVKARQ